jgi:hypothetical protein
MINAKRLDKIEPFAAFRDTTSSDFKLVLLGALVHLPLGVLIYRVGSFSLLHPLIVFLIGMRWATQKHVKLERIALVAAYLVAVEILWRMAGVPVFWEVGKYGSSIIMFAALWRRGLLRVPSLPLVYLGCLVPACFITLWTFDLGQSRQILSSAMSGPLLLFVSSWFFSHVSITTTQLRRLILAIIIPLLSAAAATLFYTVTAEDITFTDESNFATSGGFGPNQVSAMLGLGAFVAVMCLLIFRNSFKYKVYFASAAILFSAQSVMTFSRGGMYNAVGATLVVAFFLFRDPSAAARRLLPVVAVLVLFMLIVFPFLNDFTGGNLQERFEDTQATHRSEIATADYEIFLENPIFGVGVGSSYEQREEYLGFKAMSHTEFARLLSEHGMFGIAAILALLTMSIFNISRQRSAFGRAFVAGLIFWCFFFMLNAGMRLAAPSFLLGLTFVSVTSDRVTRRSHHRSA